MTWKSFLAALKERNIILPRYMIDEFEPIIACGTLDMGFEVFKCPNCHHHHILCYTCKSRFCPSCGTRMAKERAQRIAKSTLDVNHRHIVFTIDERLRKYFSPSRHPEWLNFLFDAAKEALFYFTEYLCQIRCSHTWPPKSSACNFELTCSTHICV